MKRIKVLVAIVIITICHNYHIDVCRMRKNE